MIQTITYVTMPNTAASLGRKNFEGVLRHLCTPSE